MILRNQEKLVTGKILFSTAITQHKADFYKNKQRNPAILTSITELKNEEGGKNVHPHQMLLI